jgi:hypothetical protein
MPPELNLVCRHKNIKIVFFGSKTFATKTFERILFHNTTTKAWLTKVMILQLTTYTSAGTTTHNLMTFNLMTEHYRKIMSYSVLQCRHLCRVSSWPINLIKFVDVKIAFLVLRHLF